MRNLQIEKEREVKIKNPNGRYIFAYVFVLLVCVFFDKGYSQYSILNDKFIFGYFGNNLIAGILSIILVLALFFLVARKKAKYLMPFSILAAAVTSNILERIYYGGVTDYFNFWLIPTFNFADILIVISLISMACYRFKKSPF